MDCSTAGTLSFHNINYTVGGTRSNPCCKRKEGKQILHDVSGVFTVGMNAIMGPSGCGKSSLLDILADRKDPRGLTGRVLLDGSRPPPSFKYIVGYVVQDDIISGTLTVRENLMFSANVRLSGDITDEERQERVSKVIKDLGLESCAETKVGNEAIRGVSGGERKRACIGMELVLAPKILFLDEPTTGKICLPRDMSTFAHLGLDASTARNVMQCLSKLSKQGRKSILFFCETRSNDGFLGTIVFSIHQPRYSTFKLFDQVLFLCKGISIYRGSAEGVVPYFGSHGYQCEMYDNPADFALDTLIDASRQPGDLEKLDQIYRASAMHTSVVALGEKRSDGEGLDGRRQQRQGAAARSVGVEIFYVAQRTLRNSIRSPQLLLAQTMISIVLGLLVGVVFFDLKKTTEPGVQDRFGTLFFIVMNQIFSTLSSLEPLLRERTLFIHVSLFSSLHLNERSIPFAGEYQWLLSDFHLLHRQARL